ncbi:hypothetical protein CLU79DRAFT_725549 [Phycomyces nitens]|nr:hypothetical protein CLU79DRAFT_725549 [Phycomyces nitens]
MDTTVVMNTSVSRMMMLVVKDTSMMIAIVMTQMLVGLISTSTKSSSFGAMLQSRMIMMVVAVGIIVMVAGLLADTLEPFDIGVARKTILAASMSETRVFIIRVAFKRATVTIAHMLVGLM